MARTSMQMCRAATNCLYRDVAPSVNDEALHTNPCAYEKKWAIVSRTLSAHPELAKLVRVGSEANQYYSVNGNKIGDFQHQDILEAVELLGLDHHFGDLQPTSFGPASHIASSVALLQAINIRRLSFWQAFAIHPACPMEYMMWERVRDTLLWRVIAAGNSVARPCGQPFFANLNEVELYNSVDGASTTVAFPFAVVGMVLQLPVLRRLSLAGFQESIAPCEGDVWRFKAGSSNVQTLQLDRCDLGTSSICRILNSCKALVSFYWNRRCPHENCLDADVKKFADFPRIYQSLLKHQSSLEILSCELTLAPLTGCNHRIAHADVPFETLEGLHQLEMLSLEASALYRDGHNDSPPLRKLLPASVFIIVIGADENTRLDYLLLDLADLCRQRPTNFDAVVHLAKDFNMEQLGDLPQEDRFNGVHIEGGRDEEDEVEVLIMMNALNFDYTDFCSRLVFMKGTRWHLEGSSQVFEGNEEDKQDVSRHEDD